MAKRRRNRKTKRRPGDTEANLAAPFVTIVKESSWAMIKSGFFLTPEEIKWVKTLFDGLSPGVREEVYNGPPEMVGEWATEAIKSHGETPFADDEDRAQKCGAYLAATFGNIRARGDVLKLLDEAAKKSPGLKSSLGRVANKINNINAVSETEFLEDTLGTEGFYALMSNLDKVAPDVGIVDLSWAFVLTSRGDLSDTGRQRLIRENYPDPEKARQVRDILGFCGESVMSEPTLQRLTKPDQIRLTEELGRVVRRLIDTFVELSQGTGKRRIVDHMELGNTEYLLSMSREIQGRYPYLDREQAQSVLDFCRGSLHESSSEVVDHVQSIERIVDCFPDDEIQLILYSTSIDHWYSEENDEVQEVVGLAAAAMRRAAECLGLGNVAVIVESFTENPSSKPGRAAVRHYLTAMSQSFSRSNESGNGDVRPSRLIWNALRSARVFEVSSDTFGDIVEEVHQYLRTKVMEIPGEKEWEEMTEDEGRLATSSVAEAAKRLPVFDDIMPFKHLFVGFDGNGIDIPDLVVKQKVTNPPKKLIQGRLLGYLIGPVFGSNVDVIEFIRVTGIGSDFVVPCIERLGNISHFTEAEQIARKDWSPTWMRPGHMTPWVVNSILSYIHEHKTFVQEQHLPKKVKRSITRETQALGFDVIPRPFYTVPLRGPVAKGAARRSVSFVSKRSPLAYRHDRRGHERVLVQRGPFPITEEKRKSLERPRGTPPLAYTIYTVTNPNAEHSRLLMERNQAPKREGEWLAIKVRYIDNLIVGDESLPYVPGVRVSTESVVKRRHLDD